MTSPDCVARHRVHDCSWPGACMRAAIEMYDNAARISRDVPPRTKLPSDVTEKACA